MSTLRSRQPEISSTEPQPAWDVARLFPDQGTWTEEEYFRLNSGNRFIEFDNGRIEVLPMPSIEHQCIANFLLEILMVFVRKHELGRVFGPVTRIRIPGSKHREPDVTFIAKTNQHRHAAQYFKTADLVMEVVSPDDPDRDYITKRLDYARAGIAEYWIVDPRSQRIMVLTLVKGTRKYHVAGEYTVGQQAASVLLHGFEIDVASAFAAARIE